MERQEMSARRETGHRGEQGDGD